jgi:hypothetical protein
MAPTRPKLTTSSQLVNFFVIAIALEPKMSTAVSTMVIAINP